MAEASAHKHNAHLIERLWRIARWSPLFTALLAVLWIALDSRLPADWFLTPDQQAERLYRSGKYAQAAQRYANPMRSGVAHFRAGEFEAADRGNALLMQGKYDQAVEAYDRALELEPGWREAAANQEIARLRAERLVKEGGEMTGGKMEADEYVFDLDPSKGGDNQIVDGGEQEAVSDQQLQAMWLRRVQTRPADFLQARFAYQLFMEEEGEVQAQGEAE
jgi:Ca-activated chloride channel family protein